MICRKDKGVIDEIPGAYKNIDEVMANQSDLVDVVHTLKQVHLRERLAMRRRELLGAVLLLPLEGFAQPAA